MPEQFESVGDWMPKWEPTSDRGLWTLSDPRLRNSSQDAKEVLLWSSGRTWVNVAARPCLQSFLTHNKHHSFENKVWDIYIFIKKCIRSLLKSSLPVNDVSASKCIFENVHVQLYVAIQHLLSWRSLLSRMMLVLSRAVRQKHKEG